MTIYVVMTQAGCPLSLHETYNGAVKARGMRQDLIIRAFAVDQE